MVVVGIFDSTIDAGFDILGLLLDAPVVDTLDSLPGDAVDILDSLCGVAVDILDSLCGVAVDIVDSLPAAFDGILGVGVE